MFGQLWEKRMIEYSTGIQIQKLYCILFKNRLNTLWYKTKINRLRPTTPTGRSMKKIRKVFWYIKKSDNCAKILLTKCQIEDKFIFWLPSGAEWRQLKGILKRKYNTRDFVSFLIRISLSLILGVQFFGGCYSDRQVCMGGLCVYLCVSVCVCLCRSIRMSECVCVYLCLSVTMCVCGCVWVCVSVFVCMCLSLSVSLGLDMTLFETVCLSVYVIGWMYVCVCVCVWVCVNGWSGVVDCLSLCVCGGTPLQNFSSFGEQHTQIYIKISLYG